MSKKYVIEIKPEYEDIIRGIMVLGAKDSNLYMGALEVEDMEELTSDYINEHFGSLQDDAYKRGLEDGKAVNDKGCEGCLLQGTGSNICDQCCNSYANQWMARDNKIEVGDEVIYNQNKWIVIAPETNERYASLFDSNGNHCSASSQECHKTGRHFDIAKILEDMRK